MPIQPEPTTQIIAMIIIAAGVVIMLYTIYKIFPLQSPEEQAIERAPFDAYCTFLELAERLDQISETARLKATNLRAIADRIQRDHHRSTKAIDRGPQLRARLGDQKTVCAQNTPTDREIACTHCKKPIPFGSFVYMDPNDPYSGKRYCAQCRQNGGRGSNPPTT